MNGIGPTQGQRKNSDQDRNLTHNFWVISLLALLTDLQGQMGAGPGNLGCQFHVLLEVVFTFQTLFIL